MNESLVDRLPPIIDIGPERQLFLDDLLIDSLENAARFVHQPVKSAENPVFAMEKPWEGQRFLYCDLAVDSETGHYKLWYSIYPKLATLVCVTPSRRTVSTSSVPNWAWSNSTDRRPTTYLPSPRASPTTCR